MWKNDLLWMCAKLIIPREFHDFYTNLVVGSTAEEDREDSNEARSSASEVASYSVFPRQRKTRSQRDQTSQSKLDRNSILVSIKKVTIGECDRNIEVPINYTHVGFVCIPFVGKIPADAG